MQGIFWILLMGAAVAAATYAMVSVVRLFALRWCFVDVPNERSSHFRPIPSGGGLVLVLFNVLGWILLIGIHPIMSVRHAVAFLVGALLVATISFVDDLGHVPFPFRLGVHAVAAAVFVSFYTYLHVISLPLAGTIVLGSGIGIALTVIWMIGLVNAYNFIDGLDGLAAGQAVAAGVGWTGLGLATDHLIIAGFGALLAASSLGFLAHNWHPARIFMGDVGSTFLGYCFAAMPLIAARYDGRLAFAGILLVWPAIFDSVFTVSRRLAHGRNVFTGHREFLFHRLVEAGWSHSAAALLYVPLPLIGAALAFTWQYGTLPLHAGVAVSLVVLCLSLWLFVRREERKHIARTMSRGAAGVLLEPAAVAEESADLPLLTG